MEPKTFTLKTCRVEKHQGISKKYDIHKAFCGCFSFIESTTDVNQGN